MVNIHSTGFAMAAAALMGAAAIVTVGVVGYTRAPYQDPANRIVQAADFDWNGIQDVVREQTLTMGVSGDQVVHKTPYFGVRQDGSTVYLSANEMSRWFPEQKLTYNGIEARLNGQ